MKCFAVLMIKDSDNPCRLLTVDRDRHANIWYPILDAFASTFHLAFHLAFHAPPPVTLRFPMLGNQATHLPCRQPARLRGMYFKSLPTFAAHHLILQIETGQMHDNFSTIESTKPQSKACRLMQLAAHGQRSPPSSLFYPF